jgi:hypothetical protein
MSMTLDITGWSAAKREAAVEAALGREGWKLLLVRDDPKSPATEGDRIDQVRTEALRRENLKGGGRTPASRASR